MSILMGCAGGFYLVAQNLALEKFFFGVVFSSALKKTHLFALVAFQVILSPFFEELLFRGVFDDALRTYTALNQVERVMLVASVFALAHYSSAGIGKFFMTKALCSGIALGILREAFGLPTSMIAHSIHNVVFELLL